MWLYKITYTPAKDTKTVTPSPASSWFDKKIKSVSRRRRNRLLDGYSNTSPQLVKENANPSNCDGNTDLWNH